MSGIAARSQTSKADTRGLRKRKTWQAPSQTAETTGKGGDGMFGLKAKEVSGFGVRGYFKQTSTVSSLGPEGSLPAPRLWVGEPASLRRT